MPAASHYFFLPNVDLYLKPDRTHKTEYTRSKQSRVLRYQLPSVLEWEMSAPERFNFPNPTHRYAKTWDLGRLWHSIVSSGMRPKREPMMTETWSKFWRINFFEGMKNDVKRRAQFYWTDWRDGWNYRVVPATVYMYFAK